MHRTCWQSSLLTSSKNLAMDNLLMAILSCLRQCSQRAYPIYWSMLLTKLVVHARTSLSNWRRVQQENGLCWRRWKGKHNWWWWVKSSLYFVCCCEVPYYCCTGRPRSLLRFDTCGGFQESPFESSSRKWNMQWKQNLKERVYRK